MSVDEKTSLFPPDAPPNAGSEGAPPSYDAEMDQPARVVYAQAPRQVMPRVLIALRGSKLTYYVDTVQVVLNSKIWVFAPL